MSDTENESSEGVLEILAGKLPRPHEPEETNTACSPEYDFVESHLVLRPHHVHGFEDVWCHRKSLGP